MATSDNKTADTDEKIFIGKGEQTAWLSLALANRHGLVTGATGTGKTVSLQVMAEGFARAGVPVFAADIKGDLSGISEVGEAKDFILKRAGEMGLKFQPDQFSTVFWDVFGEQGHPVRATVTEMGPLLLARMLDLNDVQEGVLNVAFRVADENGLTLIDMKDLRSLFDEKTTNGWSFESDSTSLAVIDVAKMTEGARLRLRYGLSGGSAVGQYAAAAVETAQGVESADAVAFTARAEKPMRIAVQVRAEVAGSAPERWERSVFVDTTDGERVVRFSEMTPVGKTHTRNVPQAGVLVAPRPFHRPG